MVDVDGTLVQNGKDNMPSQIVTEAVALASKKIHVGIASSRPIFYLRHIFDYLKLSGPSIINGGAQVIDIASKKAYFRQPINKEDILPVYEITKKFHVDLIADTDDRPYEIKGTTPRIPREDILGLYIPSIDAPVVEKLRKRINAIPTLSSHITLSWTQGKLTISISHIKASKQHAILEVAKILGITTHEIIGIGDGGNDLPLLMACGLKVAMGNAVEDLKTIADYIAPTVEEDGVAHVIEKFVL